MSIIRSHVRFYPLPFWKRCDWLVVFWSVILWTSGVATAATASREDLEFFENEIRPLLAKNCLGCHGIKKREAGLRLDQLQGHLDGGDSGPAVIPGDVDNSLLIQAIRREDGLEMPPNTPLDAAQIAVLEHWIKLGAPWPVEEAPADDPANRLRSGPITDQEQEFWSFQTVTRPDLPLTDDPTWSFTPIDRFILARLNATGNSPTLDADRRVLLRRIFFDLIGLPPTPEQVGRFLADTSPDAVDRMVDRLLASPHYGERWGRHWLDVVRYADTAGETADYPVPLAWKYRNWVIDAWNADKPYDEFLREQLAGDIMAQTADRERYTDLITATGYLAISRRFGFGIKMFHYLTLQDTIDTTGQAILGLTLGCARCHDHKYDPVNMSDYYAWYGIFESTQFAWTADEKTGQERDFIPLIPFEEADKLAAARTEKKKNLESEIASLEVEKKKLVEHFNEHFKTPIIDALTGSLENAPIDGQLADPWDSRGGVIWLDAQSPYSNVNPPGTRGLRTNNDAGNNGLGCKLPERTEADHEMLYLNLDFRNVRVDNPPIGSTRIYVGQGPGTSPAVEAFVFKGKFLVRNGNEEHEICEIELGVWYNLQIALNLKTRQFSGQIGIPGKITPFSALHFRPQWSGTIDRIFVDSYGLAQLSVRPAEDFDNFTLRTEPLLPVGESVGGSIETVESMESHRSQYNTLTTTIEETKRQLAELVGTPFYPTAFAVRDGEPHDAVIHKRGDPLTPGDVVQRRQLEILGGQSINNPDVASGRLDLADWLTRADNPLTSRVMVNRIWQYHFGRGLVETPNDFGIRGTPPSHPALLDWLADNFVSNGWSIKRLQRVILSSRTFQLSSKLHQTESGGNEMSRTALFGRYSRRRLEAEAIRDAMLSVSGRLDDSPGQGHPFPEQARFSQHGPFYAVYPTLGRSVYIMKQRIKGHPFLTLFDGADPNASTGVRRNTTTPTQALYLLNNPFVHENAVALAADLFKVDQDDQQRLRRAYQLTLCRPPGDSELEVSQRFVDRYQAAAVQSGTAAGDAEKQAWSALARTLLVRNEFLFVE